MTEVVTTDEFADWYAGLLKTDTDAVFEVVELLGNYGVGLGYPYSSSIKGSRYPFRELRCQSRGQPIRIFYAFDPKRQAVLILGGHKGGDSRFYERFIPAVARVWEKYLDEQRQGLHDEE